jgi:MOSC domain-containing protein YiiM
MTLLRRAEDARAARSGFAAQVVVSIQIAEPRGPMMPRDEVRAVAGKGLEGDRYFGDASKPGKQLTLIEAEAIEALERDYKVKLEARDARRNLVVRGVALNHLVGREFKIGDVLLRGVRLCEPCDHLAKVTGAAVLPGLVHRGGLRADILTDGTIRIGDRLWNSER